jgi:phosphate transport system substrate-binding protein
MNRRGTGLLLVAALFLASTTGLADVKSAGSTRHVEIRGAATMAALAQAVAERFMADHPDTIVTVAGGGAHRGIKSVIVGTADLGLAGDSVPEEHDKLAHDRKVRLIQNHVYSDALVIVVHPDNPVSDLPLWKLRDIFRGAILNWKEVGGKDAPIAVISHEGTSGTYETFKQRVLGDDALVTPKAAITNLRSFQKSMAKSPDAISYIGLQQASGWKPVSIDGVVANADTVRSGRYPIWRKLAIYHLDPPSPLAKQVLDYFLAPDKGQAMVRSLGDVPVK